MSITMTPSLTPHFLTEAQVISPAAAVKSPTSVEPTVSGHREYKWSIKWRNVMILIYFHSCALYALYLTAFNGVQLKTIVWSKFTNQSFQTDQFKTEDNFSPLFLS